LPASLSYATDKQRSMLAVAGGRFGCHTCGANQPGRAAWSWIADHQPPIKVANTINSHLWRRVTGKVVRQRFYPQCSRCSSVQSAAVRNLGSARPQAPGAAVVTHHAFGTKNHGGMLLGTLRPYHATGSVLVGLASLFDFATAVLLG
jgi:hypothetical protein